MKVICLYKVEATQNESGMLIFSRSTSEYSGIQNTITPNIFIFLAALNYPGCFEFVLQLVAIAVLVLVLLIKQVSWRFKCGDWSS